MTIIVGSSPDQRVVDIVTGRMDRKVPAQWSDVRAAYDRASQMAVQTVEAYAAIGDMLLRLKDETAHGEFAQRCAHALGGKGDSVNHISEAEAVAGRQRASRYMRLATNRTAWLPHNPQSLNEAMKLLPTRPSPARGGATKRQAAAPRVTRPQTSADRLRPLADAVVSLRNQGDAIDPQDAMLATTYCYAAVSYCIEQVRAGDADPLRARLEGLLRKIDAVHPVRRRQPKQEPADEAPDTRSDAEIAAEMSAFFSDVFAGPAPGKKKSQTKPRRAA